MREGQEEEVEWRRVPYKNLDAFSAALHNARGYKLCTGDEHQTVTFSRTASMRGRSPHTVFFFQAFFINITTIYKTPTAGVRSMFYVLTFTVPGRARTSTPFFIIFSCRSVRPGRIEDENARM